MNESTLHVQPWTAQIFRRNEYDGFICALGFERRARFIAEEKRPRAKRQYALAFPHGKVHSYSGNESWYKANAFVIHECHDEHVEDWFAGVVEELATSTGGGIRLCVDISSMSRVRAATLVAVLLDHSRDVGMRVDFVYSLARYSSPPQKDVPNGRIGPVHDRFAGWSEFPQLPPVVICGVGYEQDKALGAIEYIEPAETWTYVPVSRDRRYGRAVDNANKALWDIVPESRKIEYSVSRPFDTLASLESTTYGALHSGRVVFVPFGPKVFALCCLLVACVHRSVSVWRVSAGAAEPMIDRLPSGKVVGLSVQLGPS